MVDGDGIGGIGLKLDRMDARFFGRVDYFEGAIDVLIMVAGHFRDNIGGLALPQCMFSDLNVFIHNDSVPSLGLSIGD